MKEVQHFATIGEYNELSGQEKLHPVASVLDFSKLSIPDAKARSSKLRSFSLGLYAVFFKKGGTLVIIF